MRARVCRTLIGDTHLTHSDILKKNYPPHCEYCQSNEMAQPRKDIFGRKDVVESFRFHPTLVLFF